MVRCSPDLIGKVIFYVAINSLEQEADINIVAIMQ